MRSTAWWFGFVALALAMVGATIAALVGLFMIFMSPHGLVSTASGAWLIPVGAIVLFAVGGFVGRSASRMHVISRPFHSDS